MHLSRFYTKAKLDLLLCMLAVICLWLMLTASSDPVLPWLKGTSVAGAFEQFSTGNQIVFDLSVGVLSAIGMFYLLVRLPEYERKIRIKRQLNFSYQSFKGSVIQIFVGAIQSSYNTETVNRLMNQREFRDFFKDPYILGQNKWQGVENKMSGFMLRQLALETEVLLNEFQHVLSVIDIRDPDVYSFMKRLSETLYRAKTWPTDYDSTKEIFAFFWTILSGWSFEEGYAESEYILDMIAKL
ncbi:hypothetical protein [Salinicola halimionae]|uniref:hypothetical protein n=1 Tax=Salinicola halimionae TaxID=1949081 RepID=UPI000DA23CE3|nr:hypothetical protein [Salinicola halimionae]